jgi:hypothetical protein
MKNNIRTEELGSLEVFNGNSEKIPLSSLWQEKTAVLVFVRHFG